MSHCKILVTERHDQIDILGQADILKTKRHDQIDILVFYGNNEEVLKEGDKESVITKNLIE